MPPKSISNHAIYIEGCEFKGIPDFTVADEDIRDFCEQNTAIVLKDCVLSAILKIDRMLFYKVIGLYNWVINYCPNRKIVHLIRHGKNKRIRNKNFKRALRIIGKEINHD